MQSALSCLSGPNCIRLLRQLNVTALSACGVLCCALQCELRQAATSVCVRLAGVAIVSGACGFDPCKLQYHLRRIDHDPPGVRVPLDDPGDSSLARATGEVARWQSVVDVGCPTECLSVSLHSLEPAPLLPLPPFVPHTPDWFVYLPLVIANTAIAAALAAAALAALHPHRRTTLPPTSKVWTQSPEYS